MDLGTIPVGEIGWGGVVLLVVWMIFTGRLVTRREADAKDQHIEYLQTTCAEKDKTIEGFKEAIETSNAMMLAVMNTAQKKGINPP